MTDVRGPQLVDGFAGLWCVNAGYGQESIVEAADAPAARAALCHRLFRPRLGAGDPPGRGAGRAARPATSTTSTSRSAARTRWTARSASSATTGTRAASRRRTSSSRSSRAITARRRSGPGLTALPVFHAGFGVPFDWQHKIPSHYAYRNPVGSDPQAIIAASVAALRAKVAELGAERVAAFYAEPIQGSGGVLVPPAGLDEGDARALRASSTSCSSPTRSSPASAAPARSSPARTTASCPT